MPTDSQIAPNMTLRGRESPANRMLAQIKAVKVPVAQAFAFGRMTRFISQSRIMGPKAGSSNIQS